MICTLRGHPVLWAEHWNNIRTRGFESWLCCFLTVWCWRVPNFSSSVSSSVKQGSSHLPYPSHHIVKRIRQANKYNSALQVQEPFEMEILHVYIMCTVFLMYIHIDTYIHICIHVGMCGYNIYNIHCIEPEIRRKFFSPWQPKKSMATLVESPSHSIQVCCSPPNPVGSPRFQCAAVPPPWWVLRFQCPAVPPPRRVPEIQVCCSLPIIVGPWDVCLFWMPPNCPGSWRIT